MEKSRALAMEFRLTLRVGRISDAGYIKLLGGTVSCVALEQFPDWVGKRFYLLKIASSHLYIRLRRRFSFNYFKIFTTNLVSNGYGSFNNKPFL